MCNSDVDTRTITVQIIRALLGIIDKFRDLSIIQFWAPAVTNNGRRVLSTSGQPFAVEYPSKNLPKYRLSCMKYQYSLDQDNHGDGTIISRSRTATAFLNGFPELVLLKNLEGTNPLVDTALECDLLYSYLLPIWFSSRFCVGILEFSTFAICSNETIIAIRRSLMEVGLGVFQIQDLIPYKIIPGLKFATDEINEALKTLFRSNNTLVSQVWITSEDDNHVFSSGTRKKHMFFLKLTGHLDDKVDLYYGNYYRFYDIFPLEMGEDFVEKTLEDYKPRFCNDISRLRGDMLVKQLVSHAKVSRLAICLNSIHTGEFCYAFEFIWWGNSGSHVKFIEELLLKLKDLLLSFKHASGGEFGDALNLIKVGDSTKTGTKFLKIFQGKRLSPLPEVAKYMTDPIYVSKELIEEQFGNTEKVAAKNLKMSRSTLTRKCRNFGILNWIGPSKRCVGDRYSNQRKTNDEDTRTVQKSLPAKRDEHILTIKAEYEGNIIRFYLHPCQATFKPLMEEIRARLNLTGTCKVGYLDGDGDWVLLVSDSNLSDCIETSRNLGRSIRLYVLPTP